MTLNKLLQPLKFVEPILSLIVVFGIGTVLFGCKPKGPLSYHLPAADSVRIIGEILDHRSQVDSAFRFDPQSPFQKDSSIHFDGVKWYPPDVHYFVQSNLYRYPVPETVIVVGTKGDERKQLRYGYFLVNIEGKQFRLNVYKFTPSDSERYNLYRHQLLVWFTDETTGRETYGVGRYLEIGEEHPDPNHLYALNFNNAYNPYCAYSDLYSCAIPRKEDHLALAVRAGELKYH